MRPHRDKAATFGSLVVGPAGARPDGAAAAAIEGMYLGPWQEYALWRAHTQRAAAGTAGSPSFALRAAETGTGGGSVGGRETAAALSADRRSSGSSFSRSLMSMSPASGTHAGPGSSARSTAADSVSDGQSVRSLIDGSARLRRAGVSSTRPALPRSGTSRPQPKQPVPAIDAQERIERLRALYGMAPQAPPAEAATLRPLSDSFVSDAAVDASPARVVRDSASDPSRPSRLYNTDTSIQPASAALAASIASDAADAAARAAREAELVSLLQAQATRQAALEAQLERQQAVSLQMNAALTRLLEGGGEGTAGRSGAARRTDGAPRSASSLAAAAPPQQQPATQAAASDLDTASWLPVRAIARQAPSSRLAGAASSAPSAPSVLPAFGDTAAESFAPVVPVGASSLGGVGGAAARPGGVDHLLRFMGRAAQPSLRAAAVNDSGGGGGYPVLSVERAGTGSCLAEPGLSPAPGTQSPTRRGSVPDAAADDLLQWSLALRDDT